MGLSTTSTARTKNPIDRLVEILDVTFELEPSIGLYALAEITNRYGYEPEKLSEGEEVRFPELMKKLHDVLQEEAQAREDGQMTPEEAEQVLKELRDVKLVIARQETKPKEILKKSRDVGRMNNPQLAILELLNELSFIFLFCGKIEDILKDFRG